ncbi:MAG: hypothetical protein Tsb0017_23940 [Geothermobacteraceae bacterium]
MAEVEAVAQALFDGIDLGRECSFQELMRRFGQVAALQQHGGWLKRAAQAVQDGLQLFDCGGPVADQVQHGRIPVDGQPVPVWQKVAAPMPEPAAVGTISPVKVSPQVVEQLSAKWVRHVSRGWGGQFLFLRHCVQAAV